MKGANRDRTAEITEKAAPALLALLLAGSAAFSPALAQDYAEESVAGPPRELVDVPTAGMLPKGTFESRARIYPGGGLEVRVEVGLLPWFNLGGSYGAQQVIGDGSPDWNPRPGLMARVRLLEETYNLPAIALGVDTQGTGYFDEERERYQFKSRGPFVVLSKNYAWLGNLTLHAGVSRSLEEKDDKTPTAFGGMEKSLSEVAGFVLEYDVALNDDQGDGVYGQGRGYLNSAVRITLAPEVELKVVLRDLLRNTETDETQFSDQVVDEGVGRELHLAYRVVF